MRWIFAIIAAAAPAALLVVAPARAVVNQAPVAPLAPPPAPLVPLKPAVPQALRLDLPVAWQLTRTRLLGRGATTLTESFRETWTLEVHPGGILNLRSPRASVPAYAAGTLAPTAGGMPKAIVVSEVDFARLVGVEAPATESDAEATDAPPPVTTPVTIPLGKTAKGGTEFTLNGGDEEHFAVHLDIGTSTAAF